MSTPGHQHAAPRGAPAPAVPSAAAPSTPTPPASFKDTCNLPKTAFAMKANLVQNEPASQKRWDALGGVGLFRRLREVRAGAPRFLLHDGPPYANGSIHMGHLMNKCLKDFVVRSQGMLGERGQDVPYVPGWDCHGLPIEHKVMTDLVEKGKWAKLESLDGDQRRMAVRRECQQSAEKFVRLQGQQMQRLLTLGDYAHPYLTMAREYEGATLEVLATLLERGLVYRALKPVHWSVANRTALAEAELEYYDREDPSVYVDFEADDAGAVYDAFGVPARAEDDEEEHEDEEGRAGADAGAERSAAPRPGTRPRVRPSFMIWTTTPWTLPANLAIAVNPAFTYALAWVDGAVTVMAEALVEKVTKLAGAQEVLVLAKATGDRLAGLRYRHPFVGDARGAVAARGASASPAAGPVPGANSSLFTLVPADYVTLEDGTGLVHTAPGHGVEDYQTGLRMGLPVYCPVRADGTYDDTAPAWLRGVEVWKANDLVVRHLQDSGHLFHWFRFTHSYPHDWRGKTPTIFRATEQWFVSVDKPLSPSARGADASDGRSLRELALAWTDEAPAPARAGEPPVAFVPAWGRNRLRGMLESRPDWCVSRQRAWGLPIPAFVFTDAHGRAQTLMTPASVRAVATLVRARGSDAWFQSGAADLLAHYDAAGDPDAPGEVRSGAAALGTLTKGPDILDVWFESGSSWNAVMRERSGGRDFPTDLYLEGSDQHRGWFQTSLLPALGMMGRPPYRALLTHGFMVDKDGRKMSKSVGNTLEVEDLLKEYGADVARWWVASLAYENDVKVDKSYLDVAGESYRKVRNTLRFMLSNLYDFAPGAPAGPVPPPSLEGWVLGEFAALASAVQDAYRALDFRTAHARLYDFCNQTLSAVYLGAVKDRLYCDRPDSPRRRATQGALALMTDGLCRLLAPLLPHTADEAYRSLAAPAPAGSPDERCVHLLTFPPPGAHALDPRWARLMEVRSATLVAMEQAKKTLGVESPLEMGVVLPGADGQLAGFDPVDLADLLGVSRAAVDAGATEPRVLDLRAEARCERSWKRDGTVSRRTGGALLCQRCALALGLA